MGIRNHPLLTRRQLAAALDSHPRTIAKWEAAGLVPAVEGRRGKPSLYREADVRAWVRRHHVDLARGRHAVDEARARKERAQAELVEQLHQARAKVLLPADEVERAIAAKVMAARTTALAWKTMLVDRLELANQTDGRRGMQRVVEEQVDELLWELAGRDRSAAPRPKRRRGVA